MTERSYHLISMGALLLVTYIVSVLMVQGRLIERQGHRKFWNTLLLLFFLSTALMGLLLVVKVNYKLDLKWVEEAMQWHVDSGIGFALVAFFHLFWHLRYYTGKKVKSSAKSPGPGSFLTPYLSFTPLQEKTFFFMLGFISIMAQLVLLREFIMSFHGNELVIGIFLAIWMTLTAFGSRAGNGYQVRVSPSILFGLLVLMGALPLLIHILLILVNRFFFLPGYQPGIIESATSMVLLTALFTGVSGFLFAYVSKSRGATRSKSYHYRLDAFGSLAGGVLFGLVLVHLLNNLQHLSLLLLGVSLTVLWIYKYPQRYAMKWILILVGAIVFAMSFVPEKGNRLEGLRYRQEKIVRYKDTPYGNLTFTSRNDQVTGYLDGNPVLTAADLTRAEESVHYPALQRARTKSFLLLGGGLTGHITEAAKYNPERIDYCEADPWIFRLGQDYFPETLPDGLRFIPKDGRSWLQEPGNLKYEVVISTAGDPVTIGWNRYFTLEFYQLVSRHLEPGGVFCMQLSTGGNYVNNQGTRSLGINYYTLKQVFPHVLIVPGSSTYFLASDDTLSLDFPALLQKHQVQTTYVHPDYLDANQIQFDSEQLTDRIRQEKQEINRDLRPRLFFATMTGLESRMGSHSMAITGIISAIIFLALWFIYPQVKSTMYITGFTGAGIQILLIMVMQSFYGFAYLVAPIMITLFMGGIVSGTLWWKKIWGKPSMRKMIGLLGLMALLSLIIFLLLKIETLFNTGIKGQFILGVFNFIPGMLVGTLFAMAVNLNDNESNYNPGILYSADLTGAALGTLLPVVFLLPLIGVMNTFILFCGINVATVFWLLLRGHVKKG
jgi:spermidine synthase